MNLCCAYHSQIPSGNGISSDPEANTSVAHSVVKLMVNKGPEPVWIKMQETYSFALTKAKVILSSITGFRCSYTGT